MLRSPPRVVLGTQTYDDHTIAATRGDPSNRMEKVARGNALCAGLGRSLHAQHPRAIAEGVAKGGTLELLVAIGDVRGTVDEMEALRELQRAQPLLAK